MKDTSENGILFAGQHGDNSVVGYVDIDYLGNVDNYIFKLLGEPIYWRSTLQFIIAMSTTKVEYMAAGEAVKEALWLGRLVEEIGLNQGGV